MSEQLQQIADDVSELKKVVIGDGRTGLCMDIALITETLKGNGQEGFCHKVERHEKWLNSLERWKSMLVGAYFLAVGLVALWQAIIH